MASQDDKGLETARVYSYSIIIDVDNIMDPSSDDDEENAEQSGSSSKEEKMHYT